MSQLEGSQIGGVSPYLQDGQLFVLLEPSTDWIRPTHIKGVQSALLSLLA